MSKSYWKSRVFIGGVRDFKFRNTVEYIANYRFNGDIFHEITIFGLRGVVYSPNTEQNLLKLPYHRPKK